MMPSNSELHTIVAKLEKQVRALKLALGAIVLVGGSLAMTAWVGPQDETLTAKTFMALDSDGIPRGMFGVLADGASVGMMFTDLAGTRRVELGADPDGSPRVAIWDDQAQLRAELGMNVDGSARLVLADPAETARAAISVNNDGSAQLTFVGPDGSTRRAVLGTLDNGQPVLLLYDAAGAVVTQLPATMSLPPTDTMGMR